MSLPHFFKKKKLKIEKSSVWGWSNHPHGHPQKENGDSWGGSTTLIWPGEGPNSYLLLLLLFFSFTLGGGQTIHVF
jgi:hypothetical protein